MVDFSCPDWFDRLRSGRLPMRDDLPINEDEASRAMGAFERLRLPDVPGQPLMRDANGDWIKDFVRAVFGLVKLSEDGSVIVDRVARKFFLMVPKKNGKTTFAAAIMLTALIRNRRPGAEFLLVGPTQATAELAYDQAVGMILADPWLSKRFHPRDHIKTIEDRGTKAKLRIKTFDAKVMTGVKPVGVLVDELHELGTVSYAAKVISQIEGGIIANPEGFTIYITTQSVEPPAGVFKDELKMARNIRDGKFQNGETLPVLYEFPAKMQTAEDKPWMDPETWPMVLPNLGRSITISRLLPKFREAQEKGIAALSLWGSQHLNVEIGLAIHGERWRGADYWLGAADPTLADLDTLLARSEIATIGIDGGGLDDLLGIAVIGRCKETREWLLWNHAWCQRDVLELRKEIAPALEDFEKEGTLTFCDDATADIMGVAEIVERVSQAGLLPEKHGIGFDPQGVVAMLDELAMRGIAGDICATVSQGFRLSSAVWGLERKLKDGTLKHAGQKLMTFCVGNAKAEQRGNAVLITKQAAGKAKIDPLCATFNAAKLMELNPTRSESYLETAELMVA